MMKSLKRWFTTFHVEDPSTPKEPSPMDGIDLKDYLPYLPKKDELSYKEAIDFSDIAPEQYIFLNVQYKDMYVRIDGRGAIAINGADTIEEVLSIMARGTYTRRMNEWSGVHESSESKR
jgi:hypothetical protein